MFKTSKKIPKLKRLPQNSDFMYNFHKLKFFSAFSSIRNLPGNASFINFSIEPEDTVVAISKSFVLNCEVKRFLNTSLLDNSLLSANVSWFKNGQAIVYGKILSRRTLLRNGSLHVSSVQSSDSGTYECKTSYNNNVLLSRKAQVRIAGKL